MKTWVKNTLYILQKFTPRSPPFASNIQRCT